MREIILGFLIITIAGIFALFTYKKYPKEFFNYCSQLVVALFTILLGFGIFFIQQKYEDDFLRLALSHDIQGEIRFIICQIQYESSGKVGISAPIINNSILEYQKFNPIIFKLSATEKAIGSGLFTTDITDAMILVLQAAATHNSWSEYLLKIMANENVDTISMANKVRLYKDNYNENNKILIFQSKALQKSLNNNQNEICEN